MGKLFFIVTFLIYLYINNTYPVISQDSVSDIQNRINTYDQKLNELSKSKNTLSNQIKIINSQIDIALLKITQTESNIKILESEIKVLSNKIEILDNNLNKIANIFVLQIIENYKLRQYSPIMLLFSSQDFNNFYQNYKYISNLQNNSRDSLIQLESVRTSYDMQKVQKENKQIELSLSKKQLSDQKKSLDRQMASKASILEITKNDEIKYQELLNKAKSELYAIQDIIAGRGTETKVKDVNVGDKIASIIQGPSCSSSGTHLHFMIKDQNNSVQNPFNYLRQISFRDDSGGDQFNPTGSWEWPIKADVDFNQGYGYTWSIKHTWVGSIYNFHNGIDISSTSSLDVYATQEGTLYQGSFYISRQKCTLRYVKVENNDTKISTLNLHVNYF